MKRTNPENLSVSGIIEIELGIVFNNHEFSLDGWGDIDNYCRIDENCFIFLECEKGQKHPNTNILKLWPYLEKNPTLKIILLQYFFPENKAPKNRLSICDFLALKLEKEFQTRFQYIRLGGDTNSIIKQLKEQKQGIDKRIAKW
jgi:hypothetical protein